MFEAIDAAIVANLPSFQQPGVLSVRPGYLMRNGWITTTPAIVVTADGAVPAVAREIGGYAVDVRPASPAHRLLLGDRATFGRLALATPPEAWPPFFPLERTPDGVPLAASDAVAAAADALAARSIPKLPYVPATEPLASVTDTITVTVHASPDAGWTTLKAFLAETTATLTVAMYDCTSAHVLAALEALPAPETLALVLDHPARNPTADQTDDQTHDALAGALGNRFSFAWALERADPHAAAWIFPNAYHIKVAVRDSTSFWLSSGNWNNSNQPDIDTSVVPVSATVAATAATSDRDWHAIVEHPGLARTFEAYIRHDLTTALANQVAAGAAMADASTLEQLPSSESENAVEAAAFKQYFAPQTITERMTIQPLLTPDPGIYVDAIASLIMGATTSFYMQTQYMHPSGLGGNEAFDGLIAAVAARQKAGVDVRIIMSQFETAGYLEKLQAAGIDLSGVRIQGRVHNKGMIVDGTIAVVSSQNWSADGVLFNRDAGLIFSNASIAAYYTAIFMHDWQNLAKQATLP